MRVIDGSIGEGGGQILRTALALSLVTGEAVRVENVRPRRPKPGLLRQHRTALLAAAEVSGGEVRGGELGAAWAELHPGPVRGGVFAFDVGTAGSTSLVLQTILPGLLAADGPSTVTIEGGTHNPWSPPFDFFERALAPLLRRMGAEVRLELKRPGFHPAGGGLLKARVTPVARWEALDLEARGETVRREARVLLANLPAHVGTRERRELRARLGWSEDEVRIVPVEAPGPGNAVLCEVASTHVTEVFSAFGSKGVPAETVARDAAEQVRAYLEAGAPVGPHLADQLMLPLALAGKGSCVTGPLTRHARTNLEVLAAFDVPRLAVEPCGERLFRVSIARNLGGTQGVQAGTST
jgi:RNA 3'-terminal phosphate cyclase (ATP)